MTLVPTAAKTSSGGSVSVLSSGVFSVDTATIDITSIAQTADTLQLIVTGRATRAGSNIDDTFLRFNNDSGANYEWSRTNIDLSSTTSVQEQSGAAQTQITPGYFPAATSTAGEPSIMELLIPGYSATVFRKVCTWRLWTAGVGSDKIMVGGGRWASTAAISRITFLPGTGGSNWLTGTRFVLYGLAAS